MEEVSKMSEQEKEKFVLSFLAANLFLEKDYLDEISKRLNDVYPKSGLPGSLKSVAFPVAVFVSKVQDADCTEDSFEKFMKCAKEEIYCKYEMSKIAQSISSLTDFSHKNKDVRQIFCFIFKDPLKDSHGDVDDNKDDDIEKVIMTIRFGRADAVISTTLHEIFELIFIDDDEGEDVHCNDPNCFMNTDSVSLVLCDTCKERLQKKLRK